MAHGRNDAINGCLKAIFAGGSAGRGRRQCAPAVVFEPDGARPDLDENTA
jgi:hypothetical protein